MNPVSSTTGIILAGGQGSRMQGTDKGLAILNNQRLIDILIERLQPQVKEIVISANRNIETYSSFGFPVIEDSNPDYAGPLAGIYHCLKNVSTEYCFITPCDAPLLAPDIVERLSQQLHADKNQLCIPSDGQRTQPLFMYMHQSLLSPLSEFLQQGGIKVYDWIKSVDHSIVDCTDISESFTNINTQEDISALENGESAP